VSLVCFVIVGNGGSHDKASERPARYLGFARLYGHRPRTLRCHHHCRWMARQK